MIRPRSHRLGKAESLFVANLKPFFDNIDPQRTLIHRGRRSCIMLPLSISGSLIGNSFNPSRQ
jgi:hypothetical protein